MRFRSVTVSDSPWSEDPEYLAWRNADDCDSYFTDCFDYEFALSPSYRDRVDAGDVDANL